MCLNRMSCIINLCAAYSYLSNHSIPNASDQLAVLAVGDQVEVVREFYGARQLLQDVNAETLAAQFCVRFTIPDNPEW